MIRRMLGIGCAVALAAGSAACSGDDRDDAGPRPTTTTEPRPIVLSALGDSFSSGEGAPPYDRASGPCHRSEASWPGRLAEGEPTVERFDHRACSGATTEHLTGAWRDRDLPPQIPARPSPATTMVTLTIGGNDVGFSSIVLACVIFRCPSTGDSSLRTSLGDLEVALRTRVYPALEAAYPEAELVHVGYPRLTPPVGEDRVGCRWLGGGDQERAGAVVDAINETVERAARAADVTYVDVGDALAGHELCTATPWVVPIGGDGQAHPTAEGSVAIAAAVADALGLPGDDRSPF